MYSDSWIFNCLVSNSLELITWLWAGGKKLHSYEHLHCRPFSRIYQGQKKYKYVASHLTEIKRSIWNVIKIQPLRCHCVLQRKSNRNLPVWKLVLCKFKVRNMCSVYFNLTQAFMWGVFILSTPSYNSLLKSVQFACWYSCLSCSESGYCVLQRTLGSNSLRKMRCASI